MQKMFIEVKEDESQNLEALLNVNKYCFYKYYCDQQKILLMIDIEGYQISLLNSLLHRYIQENKEKSYIHVFLAMNVDFLNE